jgi:cytochrome d ubiquinol oxidase subunit II
METLWFCFVAVSLVVYVVLDGFDLGAGIIHLGVARNDEERKQVLAAIGPYWDGNEVWLLAAGGTLFMAFPSLYSSAFSGFYLPLMMVLWLLMLRGIAIEFRGHIDSPVWKPLWDVVFAGASALLAIFFGAALGNVVRGVSLNAKGEFFLPLWTNFGVKGEVGILDWYTITVGLLAYVTLTQHGALWVAWKTHGEVERRSRHVARVAWWIVVALTVLTTAMTLMIQPQVGANLRLHVWGSIFPMISVAALIGTWIFLRRAQDLRAFLCSCGFIAGMLASAALGLYPYVLPSSGDPSLGLTIERAAAGPDGLRMGLMWWIPGVMIAVGYFVFLYRHFARERETSS